jgi:hypothetical protein
MVCRTCGTEIADKALVCYKCGTATTEPVHAPPAVGSRRARSNATLFVLLAALVLMVLAAMILTRASPDGASRSTTWVVAGVALLIVVLRAYARRR